MRTQGWLNGKNSVVAVAVSALAAAIVITAQGHAEDSGPSDLVVLTQAAVIGAMRGDEAAQGLLGVLLEVRGPRKEAVEDVVERSGVIAVLQRQQRSGTGAQRETAAGLLERIARLEGAASRGAAIVEHVNGDEITVNLVGEDPAWLQIAGDGPHELLIGSTDCTPNVRAYPADAALPAVPIAGVTRFSAELGSLFIAGPVALRVERGDCDASTVRLTLSLGAPRETIQSPSTAQRSTRTALRPPLPVNRVVVLPIGQQRVEQVTLATEPGFIYEVFAAPVSAGVDPAVGRLDPSDPDTLLAVDDDSGWEVGARLKEFVGTGRDEQLVVLRATDVQGEVALLVRQRMAIAATPSVESDVVISERRQEWLRIELGAGQWDLKLTDVSESLDPAMIVRDIKTGAIIETNDDERDGVLAPRIRLSLAKSTVVMVQLVSVEGGGTGRFVAKRVGKAAVEVVPKLRKAGRVVST